MTEIADVTPTSRVRLIDIPPEFAPTRDHPIRVRSRPMPTGDRIAWHTHGWAQVAYAPRGVLRIGAADSTWIVPPSRAIWVPPQVPHEVVVIEHAFLRTLYVDESVIPAGLDMCRVVEVSALLREVIAAIDMRGLPAAREQLLGALALDELTRSRCLSRCRTKSCCAHCAKRCSPTPPTRTRSNTGRQVSARARGRSRGSFGKNSA